jgi:hypothetical protein
LFASAGFETSGRRAEDVSDLIEFFWQKFPRKIQRQRLAETECFSLAEPFPDAIGLLSPRCPKKAPVLIQARHP